MEGDKMAFVLMQCGTLNGTSEVDMVAHSFDKIRMVKCITVKNKAGM